jgi:ABC-type multidrug transport system, ATPase and permease components
MKEKSQWIVLKRLFLFAKAYRIYVIFSFIFAMGNVVLSLFVPILIGNGIDYIVGADNVNFDGIARSIVILFGVIVGAAFFQWLMTYCTNKITFRTVHDLRQQAFSRVSELPLKYIDTNAHGNIMNSIVNDVEQIADGLLQGLSQLLSGVVTIIGTLIFMFSIHKTITVFVVIVTPMSLLVAAVIAKASFQKFKEQATIKGEISGYIEEFIGNQKLVKAFSYEQKAEERFQELNEKLYTCGVKAQFYSALVNPTTRLLNGIVYALVGIGGAIFAINGHLSIGQLSSFLAYANQYTKPFNEISGVMAELQNALASARRVFALIDEPTQSSDENLLEEIASDGSLELSQVDFSYDEIKELIVDFNLKVESGQRVALVGPTGCGKTTIINLLMRFYDVNKGDIRVSNMPIKDMKRKVLRDMYGMVLQDSWLYHGSVRDNIAYGKEEASLEEVMEAAQQAHAHSFIQRLPQGYDTVITEEGDNISQGQKQLLCIARIMLLKPPMLILDEATSNIDTRTERYIGDAFGRLMKGRTSFVVAHRLSTIKEADVILVLNKGKIVEQGTHEKLLEKKGFYAKLYNSQFAPT